MDSPTCKTSSQALRDRIDSYFRILLSEHGTPDPRGRDSGKRLRGYSVEGLDDLRKDR